VFSPVLIDEARLVPFLDSRHFFLFSDQCILPVECDALRLVLYIVAFHDQGISLRVQISFLQVSEPPAGPLLFETEFGALLRFSFVFPNSFTPLSAQDGAGPEIVVVSQEQALPGGGLFVAEWPFELGPPSFPPLFP